MGRKRTGSVRPYRGRWRVRIGDEFLGVYDTENEAARMLDAWLKREQDAGPCSVRMWFAAWFDARELGGDIRGVHKERSVYRQHIESAFFADWPVRRVKPLDIQRLLGLLAKKQATSAITLGTGAARRTEYRPAGRTLSRQTIVHVRRLMRDAFEQARIEGKCTVNPVDGVKVGRMERIVEDDESWSWLTLEEIASLMRTLPTARLTALFAVAIYGGLRDGELLGLRWQDVMLDGGARLKVRRSYDGPTKTKGSRRDVPLLEPARRALDEWRRETRSATVTKIGALVFPADSGGCYSAGYDGGWADHPSAAGVRPGWRTKAGVRPHVRFHDLRHTCASHLVQGSWGRAWTLHEVMQWLGHADIKTTLRYAALAPEGLLAKAAELSDSRNKRGTGSNDDT